MGTPNFKILAKLGQLPPEKQKEYDTALEVNERLRNENKKLKEESKGLIQLIIDLREKLKDAQLENKIKSAKKTIFKKEPVKKEEIKEKEPDLSNSILD